MKREDSVYLQDIIECIEVIHQHLNGMSEFEFSKNVLVQDAIVRRFEIIGEAASKISTHFKAKHPEIEWQLMKDMRNKLAHEYFGISMSAIYSTINKDLPVLKDAVQKAL